MTPEQEAAAIERLASLHAAAKSFDSWGEWVEEPERGGIRLHYRAPLRLNGALGGGASVHLMTPQASWEANVYGHIEVRSGAERTAWRIDPVEWKPDRPHTNPPNAPSHLRLRRLGDRIHPFDLNRRLGISVFAQTVIGIAVDFPRAIATFDAYLELCAEVWNCPDVKDIVPPTWSKTLF